MPRTATLGGESWELDGSGVQAPLLNSLAFLTVNRNKESRVGYWSELNSIARLSQAFEH
jgi:hypothetical protein